MAIASAYLEGRPVSSSIIYLLVGIGLGPIGLGLLKLDPVAHSGWLERATEVVVIVSLFAAGLKLRLPGADPKWRSAIRLASVSMVATVASIAAFAVYILDFSWGAGILLGAVLAPTDPVLASEVQVRGPGDRDRLRFSLTGEAGLNDGTAFPFVMLGLGLLGAHDLGQWGARWLLVDLLWSVVAGVGVGFITGTLAARFVTHLRTKRRETVILDDFVALSVIALSYGVALAVHSYGFLAVFAAGLALRRVERISTKGKEPSPRHELSAMAFQDPEKLDPSQAPAMLANSALVFDEQLERIGEVITVLMVGAMLNLSVLGSRDALAIPFLFFVVRPVAVWLGLLKDQAARSGRGYLSWMGIRGIGSLYYLMYAIQNGAPGDVADRLSGIVIACVCISIIVHGISVAPLMTRYREQTRAS